MSISANHTTQTFGSCHDQCINFSCNQPIFFCENMVTGKKIEILDSRNTQCAASDDAVYHLSLSKDNLTSH